MELWYTWKSNLTDSLKLLPVFKSKVEWILLKPPVCQSFVLCIHGAHAPLNINYTCYSEIHKYCYLYYDNE